MNYHFLKLKTNGWDLRWKQIKKGILGISGRIKLKNVERRISLGVREKNEAIITGASAISLVRT